MLSCQRLSGRPLRLVPAKSFLKLMLIVLVSGLRTTWPNQRNRLALITSSIVSFIPRVSRTSLFLIRCRPEIPRMALKHFISKTFKELMSATVVLQVSAPYIAIGKINALKRRIFSFLDIWLNCTPYS